MNVSYNWLKEYVSFDMSAEKVAEILTFIGLEVEEIVDGLGLGHSIMICKKK